MSTFKNFPDWMQLILAVLAVLVTVTLAYAQAKSDISLLQQKDTHIEQSIQRIELMLREEIERHHPRGGR
jgi:sensor domain CHASE-containing protein